MIKTNSDISIFSYQEIDSTNDESKRLLDNQKMPPYWVIADKQTAGRGRKNRFWDSPSGNFMGTYVLNISGKKRIFYSFDRIYAFGATPNCPLKHLAK